MTTFSSEEREEQQEEKKSKSRPRSTKSKDKSKSSEDRKRKYIRKYTYNGTRPLFESVIIQDLTRFVSYTCTNGDYKIQPFKYLEGTGAYDLYPADTFDRQNPLPYMFASHEELDEYVKIAKSETFETLFSKVENIFRKYVNAEDHYIVLMVASTIYSYFQDKFGTTHYIIFVGDNGSGKGSALLTYRYLAYRVFYVVSASAPNYFTFLDDIEECQGTIAEDEAEDIAFNWDKNKLLKGGYASGATIPKVELSPGKRTQDVWNTYCHKWFAMEEEPDYKKIKGIRDRSFVINMIVGKVPYNIKDIIGRKSGDSKHMELYDELIHMRKLLLAFRLLHYENKIPDINLNVIHRNEELTKPLLRLFSYRSDAPKTLDRIRLSLSKFILGRNEAKKNSIESKLLEAINGLVKERENNPKQGVLGDLDGYTFYNEDIIRQVRTIMDDREIAGKDASFYSPDYRAISHRRIRSLYESKFKAEGFRNGSGSETKRGLRFSKEWLDRLDLYYNVPDEIKILSPYEDATDATDLWGMGEGENTENEGNSNENERNSHAQEEENKGENNSYTPPRSVAKGSQAIEEYSCRYCDFKTNSNDDYDRHTVMKHKGKAGY